MDSVDDLSPEGEKAWNGPEAQALFRRHLLEDFDAGIYETYVRIADGTQQSTEDQQAMLSRFARGEAPLSVIVTEPDAHSRPDEPTRYFITKVNPASGVEVGDEVLGCEEVILVARTYSDGRMENTSGFTAEQAELCIRHATELQELGLSVIWADE